MTTKRITEEIRLSHWAQVVRERIEQGISIKDYCESQGIKRHKYFYWQRKLREAACKEIEPKIQEANPEEKQGKLVPQGWALCGLPEAEPATEPITIEIGKFSIKTGAAVNKATLEAICRVLMTVC